MDKLQGAMRALSTSSSHYHQNVMTEEVFTRLMDSLLSDGFNATSLPQDVLHRALLHAWQQETPDTFNKLLNTASYTPQVLANILLSAIGNSTPQLARDLLEHEVFKTRAANTTLHMVAWKGTELPIPVASSCDLIAALIDAGADPDSKDASGRTALEIAAACPSPSKEAIAFLTKVKDDAEKKKEEARKAAIGKAPVTPEMSQAQRSKQFQDLGGRNAVMPYIKLANASGQLRALEPIIRRKDLMHVCIVDIGGGDGLTAPVLKAIKDSKESVSLLNVEPERKYFLKYWAAHEAVGIDVRPMLAKPAQALTAAEVKSAFSAGADIVFASHSIYFEMEDIWHASQAYPDPDNSQLMQQWVERHPLTKYLDVLAPQGVFSVTLGSAQETGATGTLMQGNLGPTINVDPDAPKNQQKIIDCFKNMQLFGKHFEILKPHYEAVRNCTLDYDSYPTITRIPLGKFDALPNAVTGVYELSNPVGQPVAQFHAPEVFRFCASWWPTPELAKLLNEKERMEIIAKQKTFLNLILPMFTGGRDLLLRDETMAIHKMAKATS